MAAKWRFKNGAPFSFKLISAVIVLNFIVEFALLFCVPKFGHHLPTESDNYPIRHGPTIYFVNPWIGRYLTTGAWVQFVLLALLVVVLLLNRSQIEKE